MASFQRKKKNTHTHSFNNQFNFLPFDLISGIDGQGGMRLIFGTTVAEKKANPARAGKVIKDFCVAHLHYISSLIHPNIH